jgi:hypothetical protein
MNVYAWHAVKRRSRSSEPMFAASPQVAAPQVTKPGVQPDSSAITCGSARHNGAGTAGSQVQLESEQADDHVGAGAHQAGHEKTALVKEYARYRHTC